MKEDSNQPPGKKRPRGILSEADREYLRGERDLSESAERNTRQRIRERTRAGLADFELLWQFLSDRDLELLFYPEDKNERRNIRSWSHHAIAFIRLGLWTSRDPHTDRIEDAIEQAAFAAGWATSADMSLEKERIPEGNLLLAKIKHKSKEIDELRNRIVEEDFGGSTEKELREKLNQELSIQYYLYEQAMRDPTVDAEELASTRMLGMEHELVGEDIEKERKAWDEIPIVRRPMPIVVDVSHSTDETSGEQQSESVEDS